MLVNYVMMWPYLPRRITMCLFGSYNLIIFAVLSSLDFEIVKVCKIVDAAPGPKSKKPKRSSHLSGVSSVGITIIGELNERKFNEFMSNLLQVC